MNPQIEKVNPRQTKTPNPKSYISDDQKTYVSLNGALNPVEVLGRNPNFLETGTLNPTQTVGEKTLTLAPYAIPILHVPCQILHGF